MNSLKTDAVVFIHPFWLHRQSFNWRGSHILKQQRRKRSYGSYQQQESYSRIDDMIIFLKQQGIESITLCGEMGPYDRSNKGCVGEFALKASLVMQVRGLENCIYPLLPYEKHYLHFLQKERMGRFIVSPLL